jgi:hypothetical protein
MLDCFSSLWISIGFNAGPDPGQTLLSQKNTLNVGSVGDPDLQDPHVLGHPDPDLLVRGMGPDPNPSLFS